MVIGTAVTLVTTFMFAPGLVNSKWVMDGIERARNLFRPILGLRFNLLRLDGPFLVVYVLAVIAAVAAFVRGLGRRVAILLAVPRFP